MNCGEIYFLPSIATWFFAIIGIVSCRSKYVKIFISLSVHVFYFWTLVQDRTYINANFKEEFVGHVMKYVITAESVLMTTRLAWNFANSDQYFRIIEEMSRIMSSVERSTRKMNLFGMQLSIVTIFVIIEISLRLKMKGGFTFHEVAHHINWIVVSYKHALEGEFLALVCGEAKITFTFLNEKLLRELGHTVHDLNTEEDVMMGTKQLRRVSMLHFRLVDCVKSLSSILTLDTYLFLVMNIFHLIHSFHFIVDSLFKGTFGIYHPLWVCHEVMKNCLVIFSWTSLADEANKSVLILHDIWNVYAEKNKINGHLKYLQFLSLRFLTSKVKFTAYGFFPLDWTFLHTVISLATTYIVILIQLRT